jgi:hypothetical protein
MIKLGIQAAAVIICALAVAGCTHSSSTKPVILTTAQKAKVAQWSQMTEQEDQKRVVFLQAQIASIQRANFKVPAHKEGLLKMYQAQLSSVQQELQLHGAAH